MKPYLRMRYLDHCGSCGVAIVTFQSATARTRHNRLVTGCDCSPNCSHPHAASVYDIAYAVMGEPVRSRTKMPDAMSSERPK